MAVRVRGSLFFVLFLSFVLKACGSMRNTLAGVHSPHGRSPDGRVRASYRQGEKGDGLRFARLTLDYFGVAEQNGGLRNCAAPVIPRIAAVFVLRNEKGEEESFREWMNVRCTIDGPPSGVDLGLSCFQGEEGTCKGDANRPLASHKLLDDLVEARSRGESFVLRLAFVDIHGNWDSRNGQIYEVPLFGAR